MLGHVEGDEPRRKALLEDLGFAQAQPVVAAIPEAEMETPLLPHDHPKWVKDTLGVSNRAREVIARLKPIVMRVFSFWDHRIRSAFIGGTRVSVDPSGSYRAE